MTKKLIDAEEYKKEIFGVFPCNTTEDINIRRATELGIDGMSTVLAIPENATNGEMLMALFPTFKAGEINSDTVVLEQLYPLPTCVMQFNRKWWNAPYKCKESEE